MAHKFKKSLGQNFLKSSIEIRKILTPLKLTKDDFVVEIGPGDGAISSEVVKTGAKLLAIELDYDLLAKLLMRFHKKENFFLEEGDFLEIDLNLLLKKYNAPNEIKFVGNLPFNFYKQILDRLFKYNSAQSEFKIKDIAVVLQDEVAKDYVAKVPNSSLRANTALVYCDVVKKFETIQNYKFSPKPKVNAAIIHFIPKKIVENEENLIKLLQVGFSSPRKTLKNNLGNLEGLDKVKINEAFKVLNLEEKIRPSQLNFADWQKMAEELFKLY